MNKMILAEYMKNEPASTDKKYIFIVDSQEIVYAIIAAGYCAVLLSSELDYCHDLTSFQNYMTSIALTGTYQLDYCYVPACLYKRSNDALEDYFKSNHLNYHPGWHLFKGKEYLAKFENQEELKATLLAFILRFDKNPREHPDLNRFHKYNDNGKRTDVLDMEIVDYLIQTVHFFIIETTPYIYNHGIYESDSHGNILKSKIQHLLYRDCIKASTIQSVYNLLIDQPQVHHRFSDLNNQPSHWINFLNGYYDVKNDKLMDHNPAYLSINQIPFPFHPSDKEAILNNGKIIPQYFLLSMPDQDEQMTFWQYLGYCMTTDTRFQKFLMFKGEGGTGKSIAISLIQYVIGQDNCACVSLQDLNKRFYPTALQGKLLNACADIPSTHMDSDDVIKKATVHKRNLFSVVGYMNPIQSSVMTMVANR